MKLHFSNEWLRKQIEQDDDLPCEVGNHSVQTTHRRFGFKGKHQLPLFMIWDEYWEDGKVVFARVVFNSMNWIGR
jgi:hypothetical protein